MRELAALHADLRVELFVTEELTPDWISFARRVAGTLVATEGDPLSALGYAVTAGMTGPIVVAMARRYRTDCSDLIAAGAIACVTMPIAKADVDRMLPLLSAHAAPARMDSTLRLLLDPISRVVRFREKCVRLSQREFAVLHCLSSHGGRPVSAEELLTDVWGGAAGGRGSGGGGRGDTRSAERSRQILDVYIFQLRKKLEQIGLRGAISTVRAFGYSLGQTTGDARTH
jgi:DNA-binding response OmpR family regulator